MAVLPNPRPTAGAAVRVEHVSRVFGDLRAIDDVSFAVNPGEFLLITGRSGAGKSTLLNLIAAFDRPDTGQVVVDGTPVQAVDDVARFRREVVGFVFQLHHLMAALTAQENVEIPLYPLDLPTRERHARAREALAEVGLERRATHRPSQLSGGERQRVAVARALVNHPRLLLADEPTAALDEQTGREILELLERLRREHGMTVVLDSYDSAAHEFADRLLWLQNGSLQTPPAATRALP